jgi:hypothetical protein
MGQFCFIKEISLFEDFLAYFGVFFAYLMGGGAFWVILHYLRGFLFFMSGKNGENL